MRDAADRGLPGILRRRAPVVGLLAIGLGLALALLVLLLGNGPLGVDRLWMGAALALRAPAVDAVARVLDFLGGGWFAILVVPLGGAAAFLLARRPRSAATFVAASAASAALVQLLKAVLARARPEDVLVAVDAGSFPSGHTANAATIAVLLVLLVRARWAWIAGAVWLVLMALARTILGAHWLSDIVGGALLGAGIALLVWWGLEGRRAAETTASRPLGP